MAGGDKCEFGTHGDTDLVRRKDSDANHHTSLIVPRSGLDHTGIWAMERLTLLLGRCGPYHFGRGIPATKAMTIRATRIPTETATQGKIHANSAINRGASHHRHLTLDPEAEIEMSPK